VAGGKVAAENQDVDVVAPKEDKVTLNEIDVHDINNSIHAVCQNIDSLIQDILKEHPGLQKYDTHIIE
jgi:hypothetical protein